MARGGERNLVARDYRGAALNLLLDFHGELFDVDAEVLQRAGRDAIRLTAQSQQDMLGPHIFAAEPRGFFSCGADHVLGTFRKAIPHNSDILS